MVPDWQDATIWQVAGGSRGRNYANDFVNYDIVAVGGADTEPSVERFLRIQTGDLVVLRDGGSRSRVRAIGVVAEQAADEAGPYFAAQGWPLEYICRVRWLVEEVHVVERVLLPRERVSHLGATSRELIISILEATELDLTRPLRKLPESVVPVEADGLALAEPLQSLRLLAERFQKLGFDNTERFGPLPRENEATSHFVVPLLVALGWPYHLIAVEWHRIDVAVFTHLPRRPENCHLIVEVKYVGTGPKDAEVQLARYKAERDLPPSTQRYASDGFRFWAFREEGRTLELDLTHPTVDGLEVLDRLRPTVDVLRS